jgi:hypothetical protein
MNHVWMRSGMIAFAYHFLLFEDSEMPSLCRKTTGEHIKKDRFCQ